MNIIKKLVVLITITTITQNSFGQEFSFPLFFEDAIGNKDTIVFGYDAFAIDGIDLSFGEANIKGLAYNNFDVRISNNDFPDPVGGDSAHFYEDATLYQTKKQIYYYDSLNGNTMPVFAINIYCKHFPIKIKWENPSSFSTFGRYYTLVTNWHPNGWPDAKTSFYEKDPIFLRTIDSAEFDIVPHCYINAANDTMRLLYFAFVPQNSMIFGIDNYDKLFDLARIYPTLGNGIFNVFCIGNFFNIDVYDAIGKNIFSKNHYFNQAIIDLSRFKTGNYFVRLKIKQNEKSFKIILKKN